jgi:hypothetical protein
LGRTCHVAPGIFTYTSNLTNATYTFNTFKETQAGAQNYCVDMGGHLVAYKVRPPLAH